MTLPVAAFVLAVCLGAVQTVGTQVLLQDAAADAARSVARGDSLEVARDRARGAVPGAAFSVSYVDDSVCVTLATSAQIAGSIPVAVEARSCALTDGR